MPKGSSASVMNEEIKDLKQMAAYLDDVVVFDSDPIAYVQTIRSLFERLRKHNFKLSPSKARLGAIDASFLGHSIFPAGLRPNAEKMSAFIIMPTPTDVKQVRALMDGINYYRIFCPICPRGFPRLTRFTGRGIGLRSRPLWNKWCQESCRSLRLRRFWFSPIGTMSPMGHVRSTCTATL